MGFYVIFFGLLLNCLFQAGRVSAQPQIVQQLVQKGVCLGYNPDSKQWGAVGGRHYSSPSGNCPNNHVFAFLERFGGDDPPGRTVPVSGVCCPVPEDVLTAKHVFAPERCPAQHVVTGVENERDFSSLNCQENALHCQQLWEQSIKNLRCTEINTERYQLADAKPGIALGWVKHFSTTFAERTTRARIPLAWRYAAGRTALRQWSLSSCVGRPWGALFVGRRSKYCSDYLFSELQFRPSLIEQGVPKAVRLIPDCDQLTSKFDPNAQCVSFRTVQPTE